MADPLSISASIAGLVTLADVAFSRTYKYVKAVKNASKEISALSSELCALYGVLCSVRSISIQLEDEAPGIAARSHCINSCQKTLEEIQGILDRDKTSSLQDEPWETMKRKLHWPFKSSEVKSLISDIERHKKTLGLALEADGIAGLLQVLSGQKDLHSSLEEIKKQLCLTREIETRIMLDESRETILRTFGKIDPRRSHDMSRKLRHPGTGIWLTESPKFQHWLHSANGCLWLYGIPGAGKTVLASLVIDEVMPKSTPNHAVAYFYCDYKDQMTQEPHGILGSLAQQISKQDEQSFEKLRGFYEDHGQGRKEPVPYDPTLLRNLISDMITNFDSATIIIDALDECVRNERDVTELLTSLGETTGVTNVKLLLLSRDEFEIRNFLDASPQISIAAENSDLRLYVGYEIEERMRKNRLRIKSPSLKELIVERLINGAEGMYVFMLRIPTPFVIKSEADTQIFQYRFRWVTCQIDHLCELPSDAARRKALQDLPRGLTLTYERILDRVNQKGAEVQRMVRRTLNWLIFQQTPLSAGELCHAVAINLGDVYINVEAIPDVSAILHHCGSLVRMSADGRDVEFAHFTVKEFLSQLDATKNGDFAAFVMNADYVHKELAKVCLTYINMQEFEQYEDINDEIYELRNKNRPFRVYANECWPDHVRDWNDVELVELLKQLFHPAKPSTLVSWAQEVLFPWQISNHSTAIAIIRAGIKEATALHYAAMLCIPEICEWLIENGCDVNRWSAFGTPLQCAIVTLKGFCDCGLWIDNCIDLDSIPSSTGNQLRTLDVLLRAGSNPNKAIDTVIEQMSTLSLALKTHKSCTLAVKLLENGSYFSEKNLQDILEECETEHDYQQVEQCFRLLAQRLSTNDTKDMTQQRILKQALGKMARHKVRDLRTLQPRRLLVEETAVMDRAELESSMTSAAEFGQLEPMVQLLDQYHIPVDTACEGNRETALHLAAANDHLEITKALIDRGASTAAADNVGRTALHHSIRRTGCICLRFLLENESNVNLPDNQGLTPWHLAIDQDNIEALKLLKERGKYRALGKPDGVTPERSPLSYAAEKESVDHMSLLISDGCGVHDVETGGLTPLHHAAKACSLESIRFLVENGSIISPLTDNGSSPLHYAVAAKRANIDEVVAFLVSKGSNPFLARHDGLTSIDILIEGGSGKLGLEVTGRVLQTLIDSKVPDRPVNMDLSQQVLRLCQLGLISQSLWLATALKILLDNGADLMRKNQEGKTAFSILLYSWQQQFSRLKYEEVRKLRLAANKATMIIRTALDHVPAEILVDPGCDLSNLLLSAVTFGDEELARRLLQFSPDVDRPSFVDGKERSPIGAACFWHCSDDLCKSLLDMSKALSDQAQATQLFTYISRAKRIHLAEIFLEAGFNPNSRSLRGETPLLESARRGKAQIVTWLIEHGGDVKAVDRNGWNAAHHACRSGNLEVIRVLRTTDIDWQSTVHAHFGEIASKDVSLLHLAAYHANDILLKYLIDEGLAHNLSCTTSNGLTALHLAVWTDRFDSVALLLSKNVMTSITSFGECPLHVVARLGRRKMYSLFRSHECDLDILDGGGLDCEMIALKYGHQELAGEMAFDKLQGQDRASLSKDSNVKKSLRMLKLAIELGDLGLCEKALAAGVNLEVGLPDCNGSTPLSYCVEMEKPEMAKFLVLKGASNMSVARKPFRGHGFTLFHYAAECKNSALLEILLEKHSWQLLQNVAPVHPIHVAILASATECVELMLHHTYRNSPTDSTSVLHSQEHAQRAEYLRRCDALAPVAKTAAAFLANLPIGETLDHGWETYQAGGCSLHKLSSFTPLHLAACIGDCNRAKILLAEGSLIDAVTSTYWTALHLAADRGHGNMARLLLASGAQASSRNTDGETPSMVAAFAGDLEVLRPLLESGIDLETQNHAQETILHLAAWSGRTEALVHIMTTTKDYGLESESVWGDNVLILAFGKSRDRIGSLMNLGPSPRAYTPRKFNVLTAAIGNKFMTVLNIKMLLKRIPSELFTLILNHRAYIGGTPLYAACTQAGPRREIGIINLLLDAGAHIDQDGGPYGTPLMAACTVGRLSAVKLLVSRGAQTWCVKDGQTTNVLTAAKRFPDIIYWLLVGRFAEGPRRLTWDSSMI